ncbi:MAG: hypothetical protein EZS28_041312, partial [Streblomastix strix]
MEAERINIQSLDTEFFSVPFDLKTKYNELFVRRTTLILPLLRRIARNHWENGGAVRVIDKLIDVHGIPNSQIVAICGIIFKDSKKRPNAVKIFQRDRSLVKLYRGHEKFLDESDELYLEDIHSRVQLTGAISASSFVTGVPLTVLGRVEDRGLFNVIEYANMGIPPQKHQLTKS